MSTNFIHTQTFLHTNKDIKKTHLYFIDRKCMFDGYMIIGDNVVSSIDPRS